MTSYRAAIVGCGRIGSEYADDPRIDGIYSHAEAYVACPETTLAAICDIDPDKLQHCGERWNVAAQYQDAHQMLAEQQPDIVSICTPDETHYDLVHTAIAAHGVRAVLAEKPLTLNLAQAEELIRFAAERGVVLAVNYTRRYAESYRRLEEFLKPGGIGEVQTVGGYYTKGTLHSGTHWFDLARFLVGEVAKVWGADVRREDGDDPTLDAFLEFECGASAYLHGCSESAFSLFEMDLIGTRGRVRVVEPGPVFETYRVVNDSCDGGYRTLAREDSSEGGMGDVLLRAVEDLVHCIREGGQPRCSGADGVAALRIGVAVRDSACSGRTITLGGTETGNGASGLDRCVR